MSKRADFHPSSPIAPPGARLKTEVSASVTTPGSRKRRLASQSPSSLTRAPLPPDSQDNELPSPIASPVIKKSRTNTPWTAAEEQRLRLMRDQGKTWAEIAKSFPTRTEGSVKKHWYKDMHYAEFAENEVPGFFNPALNSGPLTVHQSQALMDAIKEYDKNKWKSIGEKVGKPAKACEQYAKEHFRDLKL